MTVTDRLASVPFRRQLGDAARPATLTALAAAGATIAGFVLRVVYLDDQSFYLDELSTTWVLTGDGLGEVIDRVQTDQEITPPFYFLVAWLAMKAGDPTVWLRAPSLLAGTAVIPLVYVLGLRTVGRTAGLFGAALMALSPFLIFYSTEARAYATVLLFVLLSTLALLAALDSHRRRWWAAYAALACAAMYTHYSAAFVLVAQAMWALWAHRESWRALLVANGAAAVGFLPWLPSYIDDSQSPTTSLAGAFSPFGLETAMTNVTRWSLGSPFIPLDSVPGATALLLLTVGFALAVTGLAIRLGESQAAHLRVRLPPRVLLVALLAVATPVGAALYSLIGDSIYLPRNLIASWPGLALLLGAVLAAAAPPILRIGSVTFVLLGFVIGALEAVDEDARRPDFNAVAGFIDRTDQSGDPILDIAVASGGPLTGIEEAVGEPNRVFRIGLTSQLAGAADLDPPGPEPPARSVARQAIRRARGGQLFLVTRDARPPAVSRERPPPGLAQALVEDLPPGFRLAEAQQYPGLNDLSVYRYADVGPE
jgi:mannosyltransferase